MTREERLRRAAILCCHCLRNLAYYHAGWRDGAPIRTTDFWKTVNNNFLDVCVLEWCKLFADTGDRHYWANIVTDEAPFEARLLGTLEIPDVDFQLYITSVRRHRDKFIAHLDNDPVAQIPMLTHVRTTVPFLYGHLLTVEDGGDFFRHLPPDANAYYEHCLVEGAVVYR